MPACLARRNPFLSAPHFQGQSISRILAHSLAALSALTLAASTTASEGVIVEPKYAAGNLYHPIDGARETVLRPARAGEFGPDFFTESEWKTQKLDWPAFLTAAKQRADRLCKDMEIRWARDSRGVILYGEIRSDDPFISSVIFAGSFIDRFRKNLGKELLVAIPERDRLFVFPRHGNKLQDLSPSIAERYRQTGIPVSLELFMVDAEGCRVVGKISTTSP